jgi:quinol monooxygenase YgiN
VEPELDQEALREHQALEGYRAAMREAADAIRGQMNTELAGQAAQGRA